MAEARRRSSTEIFTKSGGIFWGIVLLVVGILWLLAALGVIEVNLNVVLPLVVVVAGIYLLVTKVIGSPFPPSK
ncbi:MAG: LiaI-LiaF-like domain-containing protein [Thermoplasmata archaeon]